MVWLGLVREEMGDSAGAARYFGEWFLSCAGGAQGKGHAVAGYLRDLPRGWRGVRAKISAAEAARWAPAGRGAALGGRVGPLVGSFPHGARGFLRFAVKCAPIDTVFLSGIRTVLFLLIA